MLDFYTRVSGPVSPGRIHELAERLGLDLNRRVRTLSKGNKQKLGLVQAFMHSPELLILDEPTSGLDPLVQREFLQLVREARDNGQTVLLSSHVLSEIQQTADEVAVLSDGRIVAQGDVASIRLGAVRRVHAALADATAEETREALGRLPAPTRLHDLVVTGSSGLVRVSATVDGEVDALVKALAQFRVVDLTVEEPDLEESVLRLYGAEPGRAGSTRSAVHSSRHTGTPSASDTADAPATRREGASRAGASDGPAPSEGAATSTHAPTPPRREDSSDRTSPPAPHAEPPRLRRDRTRRGLPPAPPVQHGDEEHSR
jgi:ABC-2 type transport system ATP-binding protein